MDTMTPPSTPLAPQPSTPVPPTPPPPVQSALDLDGIRRQLKSLIVLMSILVFIAGSFFVYSVARQQAIKSCVQSAASTNSILGQDSVGVGDMVGCMTEH